MSAIPPALLDTGVTYRQIDHWVRKGYLQVEPRGTGRPRDWPADEVSVARLMAWLTQAGMAAYNAAAVARLLVRGGARCADLTAHVTVVITP